MRELERGREFVFGFEGSPTGTDVPVEGSSVRHTGDDSEKPAQLIATVPGGGG